MRFSRPLFGPLARPMHHLLLGLTAFWFAAFAAHAEPLRLAVSEGPVSLPIYVAQAERFFEREGVAVQLLDCTSGRDCYAQLLRGEANLATAAELVMTLKSNTANSAEPGAAIVATISSSIHSIKLVARRAAGVSGPDGLRGKRIGTTAGTSAQYFLDSWLVFHEIDPAGVKITTLGPGQLVSALERGELDAIAMWEPLAGKAVAALGAGAIVMPDPRIYTQHFSLMATRELIARDPAALVKFLRALALAERFIATNPARAAQLLERRLGTRDAAKSMAEHEYRLSLDQSLIATMDAQARWASGKGWIPTGRKPGNLLRSIDPAPLQQADPESASLVR